MKLSRSLLFLLLVPFTANAAIVDIQLTNGGGLTPDQWYEFTLAASFWEGYLTGYAWDHSPYVADWAIQISAQGSVIDGVGGVLGSAGPQNIYDFRTVSGPVYTTSGSMNFDSADLDWMVGNNTLSDVIRHEMAHVLGFGTLWPYNGLYDSVGNPGQYTGANGVAMYNSEFSNLSSFVPVELAGGAGTAHGHWNENDYGANPAGSQFGFALMSGWLNAPTFVSQTTLGQFEDLGYRVNYDYLFSIPEPDNLLLPLVSLILLSAVQRRRRRTLGNPQPS